MNIHNIRFAYIGQLPYYKRVAYTGIYRVNKVKERKYKLFSFHVDKEIMRMLKVMAAMDDTTMADVIRGSIKDRYDQKVNGTLTGVK